jgi:hypothetical protein
VPEVFEKIAARLAARGHFRTLEFTRKSQVKPYIRPILHLMNETFVGIYGYSPLDAEEMEGLAKQYLPLLDPRFVKAVAKDDEVVGFIIGIPNLYEGIVKAKGHLFPFGFIHILLAMRKPRYIDLYLGAVRPDLQGTGTDALLMTELNRSLIAAGVISVETNIELEDNLKVQSHWKYYDSRQHKRRRCYIKKLQ